MKDPLHAANCLGGRGLEALEIGAGEAALLGQRLELSLHTFARSFHGDHVTTCLKTPVLVSTSERKCPSFLWRAGSENHRETHSPPEKGEACPPSHRRGFPENDSRKREEWGGVLSQLYRYTLPILLPQPPESCNYRRVSCMGT